MEKHEGLEGQHQGVSTTGAALEAGPGSSMG